MADENDENKRGKVRNEGSLGRERRRSRNRSENGHVKKSRRKIEQRKSRKRSHSEPETDASSSSTSSSNSEQRRAKRNKKTHKRSSSSSCSSSPRDNKKQKKRNKKHRRRSTSSESCSSSSDSDEKHSKSSHKKNKKKSKKEKKNKLKKKLKKRKQQGAVDQKKYGAYGILRESDMFVKQQEFYCWLQEVKNVNSETLPKFEARKLFEDYMEDYNTATLPHKKYYDLEKWEAKRQKKSELKALKKARETSFSIVDDEKRHELLHRRVDSNKYAGPSRQQLLEMQQELRRRQDEEYRKKAGIS